MSHKTLPLLEGDQHLEHGFVQVGEDMEALPQHSPWWRYRWVGGVMGAVMAAAVLTAVLLTSLRDSSSSSASKGTFLWLSDIHYDQHYNGSLSSKCGCNPLEYRSSAVAVKALKGNLSNAECAALNDGKENRYSRAGCESSLALVESMLTDAAAAVPNPDFIVITGDYSRHATAFLGDDAQATVLDAVALVTRLVAAHFGSAVVLHMPADLPGNSSGLVLGNNDFTPGS